MFDVIDHRMNLPKEEDWYDVIQWCLFGGVTPRILCTSKVTNMESMFESASSFNQPHNWNTSNVEDMVEETGWSKGNLKK